MRQPLAYLDFDLTIEPGAGRDYPLHLNSPAGQARETLRLPFDDLQLENALLKLRNALLSSGGRRRKVLSPEQKRVQDFGGALFDALICGEVRSRFDVSLQEAERQSKGLRLKLRVGPPELAALPWEYLYDRRTDAYLVLSHYTPIVRYLELPRPARPLAVTPPLRVLVVIANPIDTVPLSAERERRRIETALQPLVDEGWVEIHWLSPSTWRALQRTLRRGEYHVFHFVGHGEFNQLREEGQLIFEDGQRRADRLPAGKLARLLADHRSLRLAILNACESAYLEGNDPFASTAATLVRAGLPAVVAMQFEITDDAAIELSRVFYESLADNLPVDAALAEARKAIDLAVSNTVEWGTPVLYTHAPDGQIFNLTATPLSEKPVGKAVLSEVSDLRLLAFDLTSQQLTSCLEFSIPPDDPSQKLAWEVVFRLYLDNQGLVMARYVVVEMSVVSDTDFFLGYEYYREPFLIEESPRPWHIILTSAYCRCYFEGGADFVCHSKAQQHLGLVRMLVPYGQPDTNVTFRYRARAEGYDSEESFAVKLVASSPSSSEPEPLLKVLTLEKADVEVILIPAGEFLMGSPEGAGEDDERPQHAVYLPDYHIGRTPVTNAQFVRFMEDGGYRRREFWTDAGWRVKEREGWTRPHFWTYALSNRPDHHPVVGVSWYEALAYARWAGGSLPSEAEWEKAAGWDPRIGRKLRYPWGDAWDPAKCNSLENDPDRTTPVGEYSPAGDSPYGLADAAGNVREWCCSKYAAYPYVEDDGRGDLEGDEGRVVRGGSFGDGGWGLRCTCRFRTYPDRRRDFIGFRIVVAPSAAS